MREPVAIRELEIHVSYPKKRRETEGISMISYVELISIVIIALLYLAILPIQLVIFPCSYYSICDVLYSKSLKKALGAATSRFLFILLLSFLFHHLGTANCVIVSAIGLGSFLCSWPSIYQYRLFDFFHSRIKFIYFSSCLLSVVFSVTCAYFSLNTFLPMLLENKAVYLLENTGINILYQLFGLCIPVGVRSLIDHNEESSPYMDNNTFAADLCMTYRKMHFEHKFIENYSYEIKRAADKYSFSYLLLETIILLELINRKSWYQQKIEYLACRYWPSYVISNNCTLGLAQISVINAKSYYKMSPYQYILKMLDPVESIDLCAYYLNSLLEDYSNNEYSFKTGVAGDCLDNLSDNDCLSLFIASKYICGCNVSMKKFTLVYMTIISTCHPLEFVRFVG